MSTKSTKMINERVPHYEAVKTSSGHWAVMNALGYYHCWCYCRKDAEEITDDLNEHANQQESKS